MANTPNRPAPGTPEFQRLWPTLFMAVTLPGHEQANAMLSGLVLEKNAEQEQMTTDYLNQNLMEEDNPAVLWLRQCFDRAVTDYAREAGITYEMDWAIQAWPNVNFRGDYHNLHNHPHAWLSGTYYLNVPDQGAAETFRSDLNPGAISFLIPGRRQIWGRCVVMASLILNSDACQKLASCSYGRLSCIIWCIRIWLMCRACPSRSMWCCATKPAICSLADGQSSLRQV